MSGTRTNPVTAAFQAGVFHPVQFVARRNVVHDLYSHMALHVPCSPIHADLLTRKCIALQGYSDRGPATNIPRRRLTTNIAIKKTCKAGPWCAQLPKPRAEPCCQLLVRGPRPCCGFTQTTLRFATPHTGRDSQKTSSKHAVCANSGYGSVLSQQILWART